MILSVPDESIGLVTQPTAENIHDLLGEIVALQTLLWDSGRTGDMTVSDMTTAPALNVWEHAARAFELRGTSAGSTGAAGA